jgi:hypothetical protein
MLGLLHDGLRVFDVNVLDHFLFCFSPSAQIFSLVSLRAMIFKFPPQAVGHEILPSLMSLLGYVPCLFIHGARPCFRFPALARSCDG